MLQIRWYKLNTDSSGYTEIVTDARYTIHFNSSLSIHDTESSDKGTYRVEISNSVGSASEEIEVELIRKTGSIFYSTGS